MSHRVVLNCETTAVAVFSMMLKNTVAEFTDSGLWGEIGRAHV